MCAGAAVLTRIQRVVYGVGDPKAGGAGGLINLLQQPTLNHRCEVAGGIRELECLALLREFFSGQRRRKGAEPDLN